jgi:hypothetical protein
VFNLHFLSLSEAYSRARSLNVDKKKVQRCSKASEQRGWNELQKDNQFPSESHLFAFFIFISGLVLSRDSIACIFSLSSLNSHVGCWRLFPAEAISEF